MFRKILEFILGLFGLNVVDKKQEEGTSPAQTKQEIVYKRKPLMSENDFPIIQKISSYRYQTELYRNIDFAIFSKDYKELLLLIELNDNTHHQKSRKNRDAKVQKICDECQIKLIKFYTNYPNEQMYVINRIR